MSGTLFLAGADNPGPALAVACINLFVALALVSVSLLLGVCTENLIRVDDVMESNKLAR
jgi:hypothetical protein